MVFHVCAEAQPHEVVQGHTFPSRWCFDIGLLFPCQYSRTWPLPHLVPLHGKEKCEVKDKRFPIWLRSRISVITSYIPLARTSSYGHTELKGGWEMSSWAGQPCVWEEVMREFGRDRSFMKIRQLSWASQLSIDLLDTSHMAWSPYLLHHLGTLF